MRCDRCRELVSAGLDAEHGPDAELDAHLDGCAACRAWADRAAAVTRLARTGPAERSPDVADAVVAAMSAAGDLAERGDPAGRPNPARRGRVGLGVRAGLALLGIGQLVLAVVGVLGVATGGHHGGLGIAHATHEMSAWNLALGIGFIAAAWAGGRIVAGLLPVTGAFVAVLAVLSVVDLVAGRVEPDRLASHALVVSALVLLLVHRRVLGDGGGRPARPAPAAAGGAPSPAADRPAPWPVPDTGPDAVAQHGRRAA